MSVDHAALILADHGFPDSDTVTTADIIAAADQAGLGYPDTRQQTDIRDALDDLLTD